MKQVFYLFLLINCTSNVFVASAQHKSKQVIVGIYYEQKAQLHSPVITAIAHLYSKEQRALMGEKTTAINNITYTRDSVFARYKQFRHDTADVFERLFTGAVQLGAMLLNAPLDIPNDTNFVCKLFALPEKYTLNELVKKDTLDFIITITNLKTVPNGKHYKLLFTLNSVQAKTAKQNILHTSVGYKSELPKNSLLYGEESFESMLGNCMYKTQNFILNTLFKAGYAKRTKWILDNAE